MFSALPALLLGVLPPENVTKRIDTSPLLFDASMMLLPPTPLSTVSLSTV